MQTSTGWTSLVSSIQRNRKRTFDDPPTGIAVIGHSACRVTDDVISKVVGILSQLDSRAIVNVRSPDGIRRTSPIEELVWQIGNDMGLTLESHVPDEPRNSPSALLARNRRLLSQSKDGLYAFFDTGHVMEGGTGLTVKAAYEQNMRVEAYVINDDGSVEIFGSLDGYTSDPSVALVADLSQ